MKTKHILTAMVLPTVLAACTADEIVESNNNAVLSNRAEVEAVTFAVSGMESRLAYEEGAWNWEDTDKFLLLNADNGEKAENEDEIPGAYFTAGKPTTGYEYTKGEDGAYTTQASVMTEGLYWGYAPSFNKSYKGLIEFTLSTSQDQDYYKNPENQAFITPLYEIVDGENYNNKLPLDMINWYSTLVMPLKNNTKEDITLKQIVLTNTSDELFVTKGYINTENLGGYIMAYDGEEWAPAVNFNDDAEDDVTMTEFLNDMRKEYLIATVDGKSKKSNTIVLNLDEVVLEAGESETFYMLIPATQDEISCDITIVAEEGVVEIHSSNSSNALDEYKVNHNGVKWAFGGTKNAKAYNITKFKNIGDAYYVTEPDALEELVEDNANGTFAVYNIGDWGLNADLAKKIEKSDAFVVFMNDIAVEGEAISSRAADENYGLKLTKVAFGEDATVTVKKNTKVTFASEGIADEDVDSDIAECVENAEVHNLVVEAGADVTLLSGKFFEIKNKGTLKVTATADMEEAEIETAGALNLKDNNDADITLVAGTLNYKTAKTGTDVWTVANDNLTLGTFTGNASIIVDANVKVNHKVAIGSTWNVLNSTTGKVEYSLSVTNNGEITILPNGTDLKVYGEFTNNGKVNGGGTLELHGEVNNNNAGAEICVAQFKNEGKLTNAGKLLKEANVSFKNINNGEITTVYGSRTEIEDGIGRINNTAKAIVILAAGNKARAAVSTGETYAQDVVYSFANGCTTADVAALNTSLYAINTLEINGLFTMDKNFSDLAPVDNAAAQTEYHTNMMAIKTIEFVGGSSFFVAPVTGGLHFGVPYIKIAGSVEFYGFSEEKSIMNFDTTTKVYLAEKSTLKINNAKFNGGSNLSIVGPDWSTGVDTLDEYKANCATVYNETELDVYAVTTAVADKANLTAAASIWWPTTGNYKAAQ